MNDIENREGFIDLDQAQLLSMGQIVKCIGPARRAVSRRTQPVRIGNRILKIANDLNEELKSTLEKGRII